MNLLRYYDDPPLGDTEPDEADFDLWASMGIRPDVLIDSLVKSKYAKYLERRLPVAPADNGH